MCGAPPASGRGVLVAALTFYIDDSGTSPSNPVALAAGWISPPARWKRFEREWEKVKAKETLKCFHMAHCVFGNEGTEFRDWDYGKKLRVIRKLRTLTRKHVAQGLAVAVGRQDYDDLVKGELRKRAGKDHYTYVVRSLIGLLEAWRTQRHIEEPVEFVFDWMEKRDPRRKEIESAMDELEVEPDALKRFGICKGCYGFRDRCLVTPLQSADMLAWLVYRRSLLAVNGQEASELVTESFNELALYDNRRWLEAGILSRQHLADWVSRVPMGNQTVVASPGV